MCDIPQDFRLHHALVLSKASSSYQNCFDRFTYREVSYEFRSLFHAGHVICERTLEIDTCFRPTIPFPSMKALISGYTAHLLSLELQSTKQFFSTACTRRLQYLSNVCHNIKYFHKSKVLEPKIERGAHRAIWPDQTVS
jgi:hypothetical protein